MSEKKPATHYLRLKHKETGDKIYIGSGWASTYGHNITFDKGRVYNGKTFVGIEAIKMSDGTIIKPGDYYVEFNSKPGVETSARPQAQSNALADDFGGDDSEIPF